MDTTHTDLPLSRLNVGKSGYILSLPCRPELRRRLTALGLVEGTRITAVNAAPSGDPRAYYFRGAVIALRQRDAEGIKVKAEE